MEEDESIVLLSSLLHDIGKFLQRAYGMNKKHSEYSYDFIDRYLPELLFGDKIIERAKIIVKEHHGDSNDDPLLDIVKRADHISANERDYKNSENEIEDILISVYRKLATPFNIKSYFPLTVLSTNPKRFIDEINNEYSITKEIYYNHLNNFIREVDRLNSIRYSGEYAREYYIESLLYLMKIWLFTIPSAPYYEKIPTISLYEHLRLSMAIAHTIYLNRGEDGFTFVWIDIGGIQKFIYNIHPQKALKALRGRSFYVYLLTEAVSKYLIHNLGLLECNIISMGGGHSLLLLPTSLSDRIDRLIDNIRRFIFEEFGVRLNLHIGKSSRIEITDLNGILGEIARRVADAKSRPFTDILKGYDEYYEKIFEPEKSAKNICHICNYTTDNDKDSDGVVKCDICIKLEETAKYLADTAYIIEIIDDNIRNLDIHNIINMNIYPIIFDRLNICYMLISNNIKLSDIIESLKRVLKRPYIRVYSLNSIDVLNLRLPYTLGFKLLTNIVPKGSDGDIMTFDEIVKNSKGSNLLGVLKMDVDNLGKFFRSSSILSEYSTKSIIIDLFFNGFLNSIAKKDGIYTIYAGGDDLFIVGPWDKVIEVAHYIWSYFRRFTSESKENTISAGIILCDEHTPAYIFANEAKEALESSKHEGKNRVTILNKTITWETFHNCLELYKELAAAIDDNKLSKGSIYNLLSALRQSRINDESHSVKRYRLIYTITNIKEHNKNAIELINKIEDNLNTYIEWLDIPLRLAEFATRW